jgi:hypothetical protein
MSVNASRSEPETLLQQEARIFRDQLRRVANCALNKTFELTVRGSRRRNRTLILLFLTLGFFFTLRAHPLAAWANELGLVFQYVFNPSIPEVSPDTPRHFLEFTFGAALAPRTLRYLPLFILPFFIALQSASIYLADIFEIDKPEIARDFIMQVALTGSRNSIRIGNGEVAESDRNSPIYLIGGPGKVVVELDTAALFEKPNGQPRVIGPTVKGKVILEGFERFRQAVDLRDQYTDPLDVKSRSLDGIPVIAKDVRLLFSITRGNKEPSVLSPYPFSENAIHSLIYGQASKVVMNGPYPSELPSSWTGTIQGLIRSELGGFMSRHRLAEYLASIGLPEVQKSRQREDQIIKAGKVVLSDGDELEPRNVPPAPNFQPRHIVSNLFSQFAEGFSESAYNRGVQLGWIGIGTWKTPSEIVAEKHLEAWHLSRENLGRGSPGSLEGLRKEAQLQRILRLVQNIPLTRFQQNTGMEHKELIQELLIGYREQLIETIVLVSNSNKLVPTSIHLAVKHLESVLGIKHWVADWATAANPASMLTPSDQKLGPVTSAPTTHPVLSEEEELYKELFIQTGRDTKLVEFLINLERKSAPHAPRIELIRRALNRKHKDNL